MLLSAQGKHKIQWNKNTSTTEALIPQKGNDLMQTGWILLCFHFLSRKSFFLRGCCFSYQQGDGSHNHQGHTSAKPPTFFWIDRLTFWLIPPGWDKTKQGWRRLEILGLFYIKAMFYFCPSVFRKTWPNTPNSGEGLIFFWTISTIKTAKYFLFSFDFTWFDLWHLFVFQRGSHGSVFFWLAGVCNCSLLQ